MLIEQSINSWLQKYPLMKKVIKRIYQTVMYAISPKIKQEGNVIRVSPKDNFEYYFGYYDKSPWDNTDRYMICLRVKQAYKSAAPNEEGEIVIIDTQDENKVTKLAVTHSWNVQQGCMAQWLGPDFTNRIIYNDFRNEKFCSVIYNFKEMREEKVLPLPVYDVSRDGRFALSLDFSRLHRMRPGYGYSNLPDRSKGILCPDQTCIWRMELDTGQVTDLLKYTDLAAFEPRPEMEFAEHKVNHLMINPDGNRFMVLYRWILKGKKYTRLITANCDGTDLYNLSDDDFASHCYWKNNSEVISFLEKKATGKHYYLLKDKTQKSSMYWPELCFDGHPSFSPDGNLVVTDTYPNRSRLASLYICSSESITRIARFFSPFRYDNDVRCDLHPRFSRRGDKLCIDSVFEGKRGLYIVDLQNNGH